jgi:hypothetical protein
VGQSVIFSGFTNTGNNVAAPGAVLTGVDLVHQTLSVIAVNQVNEADSTPPLPTGVNATPTPAAGSVYQATPNGAILIYTKLPGAGQCRFQSVGNTLYMADGMSCLAWVDPTNTFNPTPVVNPRNWGITTGNFSGQSGPNQCQLGTDVSAGPLAAPWDQPNNIAVGASGGNIVLYLTSVALENAGATARYSYSNSPSLAPAAGMIMSFSGFSQYPSNNQVNVIEDVGSGYVDVPSQPGQGGESLSPPGLGITVAEVDVGAISNGTLTPSPSTFSGWGTSLPASVTVVPGATSGYLIATGLNVNLPPGATINGVSVKLVRSQTSGTAALYTTNVQLVWSGGSSTLITGDIYGTQDWNQVTEPVYGGPGNNWQSSLTPTILNSSAFGVQMQATATGGPGTSASGNIDTITFTIYYTATGINQSDYLQATDFNLSASPETQITGIQVTIGGLQNVPSSASLTVQLMKGGSPVGNSVTGLQLPTAYGSRVVGTSTSLWGTNWLYTDINSTTFGVQITAFNPSTAAVGLWYIGSVSVTISATGGLAINPTGSGTFSAASGYSYTMSYGNSQSGGMSSACTPSLDTGPFSGKQGVAIELYVSSDPQVNEFHLFRSTDNGGAAPYLELPNAPIPYNGYEISGLLSAPLICLVPIQVAIFTNVTPHVAVYILNSANGSPGYQGSPPTDIISKSLSIQWQNFSNPGNNLQTTLQSWTPGNVLTLTGVAVSLGTATYSYTNVTGSGTPSTGQYVYITGFDNQANNNIGGIIQTISSNQFTLVATTQVGEPHAAVGTIPNSVYTALSTQVNETMPAGGLFTRVGVSTNYAVFIDNADDAALVTTSQAPIDSASNPPPQGFTNMCYYLNRVWGAVGNVVYYSAGPDDLNGNGSEAFPPLNDFVFPTQVNRIVPTSQALMVFTQSDLYYIAGTTDESFYPAPMIMGLGLLSYNALDTLGTRIWLLAGNQEFLEFSSAGLNEDGYLIGNLIEGSVQGYSGVNPNTAYVSALVAGSSDKAVFLGDAVQTWFRCNWNQLPEGGPAWSPPAVISGGFTAIGAVETSPGTHQLLVGMATPVVVGSVNTYQIGVRSPNNALGTFSDFGTPYSSYIIMGSIVLSQPGQLAEVESVTIEMPNLGTMPSVSVLLDEISGGNSTVYTLTQVAAPPLSDLVVYSYSSYTGPGPSLGQTVAFTGFVLNNGANNVTSPIIQYNPVAQTISVARSSANQASETHAGIGTSVLGASFENLPNFVNDPPVLAPSQTVTALRFYLLQANQCVACRHMQTQISLPATATRDEILTLSIWGALNSKEQ